jgi:hypothetical protein
VYTLTHLNVSLSLNASSCIMGGGEGGGRSTCDEEDYTCNDSILKGVFL